MERSTKSNGKWIGYGLFSVVFTLLIPASFLLTSFVPIYYQASQNPRFANWSQIGTWISVGMAYLVLGVVAGSYFISYLIGIGATLKKNQISAISFLPAFHVLAFIALILLWSLLTTIFPTDFHIGFYFP